MVLTKDFNIDDLFEIINGQRVTKSEQEIGDIPYVTATTINNGIDSCISNPSFIEENILTVSFFGDVYYHPYVLSFKDGTYGLKLKDESRRKRYVYLYFATTIEKTTLNLGGYSSMVTGEILKSQNIPLPVQSPSDTEPDWAYMEVYMKEIEKKTILKVKEENNREIARLNELVGMNTGECLEEVEYAEFRVGDLFEVTNGQKFPKDLREVGGIPLVSTTSRNNGISDHVNLPQHFETHKNIITIAYSGAVGETFYQANDVFVGETVMWLKAKEEILNKRNAHYVVAAIKKSLQEFNYGHKVKVSDVRDLIYITLPVNKENRKSPDWGFMEKYIGQIELEMRQPLLNS